MIRFVCFGLGGWGMMAALIWEAGGDSYRVAGSVDLVVLQLGGAVATGTFVLLTTEKLPLGIDGRNYSAVYSALASDPEHRKVPHPPPVGEPEDPAGPAGMHWMPTRGGQSEPDGTRVIYVIEDDQS